MLQPSAVTDAIVEAIRSIPELAVELGAPAIPPTASILPHYFYDGAESTIVRVMEEMLSPSMLVAYLDQNLGNFNGMTAIRHRVVLYARARNKAANGTAMSAPDLINMALNYPISVPMVAVNIRAIDLLNNGMWLNTMSSVHAVDTLGQDLWMTTMVWDELGDAGPDNLTQFCVVPAAYGAKRASIARLIAERDAVIALLENEEPLIEKVRAAYRTMIEKETYANTHTE